MKTKKEMSEYLKEQMDNDYKMILNKIGDEKNMNENKLLKIVATLVITIVGTMGIVLAGTQIYNTYIKKDDDINLRGLFRNENGWYSDEITAGMSYDKESNMYYKIIADEEKYKECKEKVNELPESSEIDFNKNFLLLITHGEVSLINSWENDLTVVEITADENNTIVKLAPKENPDFNKLRTEICVVVDKTLLRETIKIEKDSSSLRIEGITPIEDITEEYTKEQAINDGCMVLEAIKQGDIYLNESTIISENKYALDELIEKGKKGIDSSLRICDYAAYGVLQIIDIQYRSNIDRFIINRRTIGGKRSDPNRVGTYIYKYIIKEHWKDNLYWYYLNDVEGEVNTHSLILVTM